MAALICDICGGKLVMGSRGVAVCDSCGTEYKSENNSVPAAASSQIALSDDVERLLQKCRTDRKNARKYANLILDIDPDNAEALKYI